MEPKLTDLSYLRATCGEDEEAIRAITNMFLETTPEQIQSLEKFFLNQACEDLKRTAHKLKSSCRMFGAKDTANKLEYIELNTHESCADFEELITEIKQNLEQVFIELKQ